MAKFKTNIRLVKRDNSTQVIPIYKAMTFICKNMCNTLCKILTKYTVRCNEIATIVFFRTFFWRFLGIIQVARLVMCYISKCSAGSVVFLQVNHFLGK